MYTLANANPDGAYSITFCSNEQLIPVIAFLLVIQQSAVEQMSL